MPGALVPVVESLEPQLRQNFEPGSCQARRMGTPPPALPRTRRRMLRPAGYRPGTCRTAWLPRQLVKQSLGVFQIRGVEALGEPAVDFDEHRARLGAFASLV
jgi:hypothetical protein